MSHSDDVRRLVSSGSDSASGDEEERYGTFRESNPAFVAITRPADAVARSRQTLSCLGFSFGAFAMGNMLGWPSTALPNLEASNSSLPVTAEQGAWVGALVCLGALLQGPSTGYLITRLGRRNTMMLMCVPLFVGWMFIVCATDVLMLMAGRLITGFAAGSFSVIVPIFVSEICSPELRGALGTLFQILTTCGIFSMYVIGTYVSWKGLAIFCSVVPWIIFISVWFLQDSPTSYMMRSRPDLSRKALIWLRNTADVDTELSAIQKQVEESRRASASAGGRMSVYSILCASDPAIRRPLCLTIFLMFFQQLSGINSVIVFTVNIFQSSGSAMDANSATMLVGGLMVLATVLSTYTASRVGRRPTLMVTGVLMTLALLAFGTFFYLKTYSPQTAESYQWIPIPALITYIVSFSFGLGPLAWLMLGELLPSKVAGPAGALASMINWALAFAVTLGFTYMTEVLGDYGTYWLFACFCTIGVLVTAKYLPETRNKSLREIQEAIMR